MLTYCYCHECRFKINDTLRDISRLVVLYLLCNLYLADEIGVETQIVQMTIVKVEKVLLDNHF